MNIGQENEYVEFKESLSQLDKGLIALTAMLNKNNFGDIYFGVDDDGNVLGLTIGKDTLVKIRTRIKELVQPSFIYSISILEDENKKKYIKLHGDGTNIPYSCDGRYYIRNTKVNDSADNDLLRIMLRDTNSDLLIESKSKSQDLTFMQFFKFLKEKGIHIQSSQHVLDSYHLYNSKKEYNLLAMLLSDQNEFSIKVITFQGTDKSKMISKEEFGFKCLLLSVNEVLNYFKVFNINKVNLLNGIRQEISLFDFESFREGWINACVHNDWIQGIPPSIFIFDDRMEIISYGSIPFKLSLEEFYNGKSMPVNRSLFNIFMVIGYYKQSGHGISIITNQYGKDALDVSKNSVLVSIPFSYERDDVVSRKQINLFFNQNTKKVYSYLLSNPSDTLNDVAKNVNLSLGGVKKIVKKLVENNLIVRVGSKKDGRWIKK